MRDPWSFVVGIIALLVGGLTVLDRAGGLQVDAAVALATGWVVLAVLGLTVSAVRLRRAGPRGRG